LGLIIRHQPSPHIIYTCYLRRQICPSVLYICHLGYIYPQTSTSQGVNYEQQISYDAMIAAALLDA